LVATEIKRTRKYKQREERQRLFPIRLIPYDELRDWELFDADTGMDLAAEVRSNFSPDFSNWKDHDSYKKTIDGLESGIAYLKGCYHPDTSNLSPRKNVSKASITTPVMVLPFSLAYLSARSANWQGK
jgi:hypothetical protein